MDRRFILYMMLGILAFALWSAWQTDYHKETPKPVANTSIASSIVNPVTSLVTSPQIAITASAPTNRLVKVHTDVLDVAIDTLGGNVVTADLLKYPEKIKEPAPVRLFSDDPNKYYVAQSGLVSTEGPDSVDKQAQFKTEKSEYSLAKDAKELTVKLVWTNNKGLVVNKVFIFTQGKYDVAVKYEITNNTKQQWHGQYYSQIQREYTPTSSGTFGFSTYTGTAISSAEKPYEKISYDEIAKLQKEDKPLNREIIGGWAAMQQRYFLSVWIPNQTRTYNYYGSVNNNVYTIGLRDSAVTVPAAQNLTIASTLYVGPEITENLEPLAKGLDRTIDYGWLMVISVVLFWIMKKIYLVVGNWGWSIILVTLLIKLVFYKLSERSCCSIAKMRELSPKLQALKERFGDDRQKLSQATMELYKKEKINPLGGCLPMLIQIPFFIALYYVLMQAVELRQAPFIFWIHDLSVKDPYYILPIINGLVMILQQRLTPSTPDPAQAKMMMLMPVVFTFIFLQFPSGLVLYWIANSSLAILQQWYINKRMCKIKIKKR